MHTLSKPAYLLAASLSALAGCVDAIGFLHLGGYFISFMSGNSTRLAVNIIEGSLQPLLLVAGIIGCFVLGVMVGSLLRHRLGDERGMQGVLALVAGLLLAAALAQCVGQVELCMALMILAMGAENAVFQRGGEVVVGLTYMTGTLVKIGQKLAIALSGGARFTWAPYLLLWLGLITGGAVGTLLFFAWGLGSLWAAALWAACLALLAKRFAHKLAA
jgi:uncharacterized membrane protein YoaK (UPF0700 family)